MKSVDKNPNPNGSFDSLIKNIFFLQETMFINLPFFYIKHQIKSLLSSVYFKMRF